jgi:hypothetical protein
VVRLSPLGTAATNWPIVPAPDDRRWWVWSSRWNENWQGNPKNSEKTCPVPLSPGLVPGPPRWEAGDWPTELWHGHEEKEASAGKRNARLCRERKQIQPWLKVIGGVGGGAAGTAETRKTGCLVWTANVRHITSAPSQPDVSTSASASTLALIVCVHVVRNSAPQYTCTGSQSTAASPGGIGNMSNLSACSATEEIAAEWRTLSTEDLPSLYSSPDSTRRTVWRWIRLAVYVTRIG